LGRKEDSNAALAQLTESRADDKAYEISVAHAFRGEHNEAAEWLDRAHRQKDFELTFIKSDPVIMNDSHYKANLAKMHFPN
jgi:hypothetical protein